MKGYSPYKLVMSEASMHLSFTRLPYTYKCAGRFCKTMPLMTQTEYVYIKEKKW